MVTCKCGKVIEKVPNWMQRIQVEFVCNNCPNRQTKNIAFVSLDVAAPPKSDLEAEIDEAIDDSGE